MENSFKFAAMTNECRICLKNNYYFLPIFGDESKPDISEDIVLFGGIQLNRSDGLPKYICQICFEQLKAAILFRTSAKSSEEILKERKNNGSIEIIEVSMNTYTEPESQTQNTQILFKENESRINLVRDNKADDTKSNLDDITVEQVEFKENESGSNLVCDNMADDTKSNVDDIRFDQEKSSCDDICDDVMESNAATDSDDEPLIMKEKPKGLVNKTFIHCDYCNTGFSKLADLEKHRSSYCNNTRYRRRQRGDSPKTVDRIRREKDEIILKKQCRRCLKVFPPSALGDHIKKMHTNAKVECPICKKMYASLYYPKHISYHKEKDKTNFICDQCGKKFFFQSAFINHCLLHTNNLRYMCEHCPYRARSKGLLKTHVRTHTGDYRYKCTQCDTRCLTKSNLNSHIQRRHRGPIDFICNECNRGFYSKITLERHISVSHLGVKEHICPTCGAAFGYRKGMTNHQKVVHKRPKAIVSRKPVYLQLEEKGLLKPLQEL